jgi:putative membrane protein
MGESSFFTAEARASAAAAVGRAEAATCAEVVIAVRARSGDYRAADYLAGFALAVVTLLLLLFLPDEFALASIAIDVPLFFVIGAFLASHSPRLRRFLTPPSVREANVQRAARATFVELGITRTSGRHGVLVYVSMLERTAAVVPDLGIDPAALGDPWSLAVSRIRSAIAEMNLTDFLAVVESLGPALAPRHPHRDDDVNELPDEVSAA